MGDDSVPVAVLVERIDALSEQLREHRDEAASASEKQAEKLDDLIFRVGKLENRGEALDRLVRTVHGEGGEVGLKIRQDRIERTVYAMMWVVGCVSVVVIGKAVEWVIQLGGKSA